MELSLLIHQTEFVQSYAKHTILVAGFGSGKTEAAVTKSVIKLLTTDSKLNVGYYLPNYPLINDIAVPRFSQFFDDHKIKYKYNESKKVFTTKYGKILLRNMTKPETIVGYETFYSIIDEIDILPKDKAKKVFNKIIARNRQVCTKGQKNSIDLVSTPEGFNFLYNFAVKEASSDKFLIKARTSDNPFLPDDYIDTLAAQYTIEELTAYINGEFCNLTSGSVYKSFKRDEHGSTREVLPREPIYIGMDFNIQDMSAVVHIVDGGALYAVDEFTGIYNTKEMSRQIRERYPDNVIQINPDASCKNRRSAGVSDYDILMEDEWDFQVAARRKNPDILSRVRSVNKSFEDGKYFVNLAKCPNYTDALEQQPFKKGMPDKTLGIDGVLDAGGYCVVEQIYTSGMD
jgi:phage terminase large subunit